MKIYYSRSNNVDDSVMNVHLGTFVKNLPEQLRANVELTKHKITHIYNPQLLDDADIVIVGMPDLNPDANIEKGCYSEILRALELKKPVFVITRDQYLDKVMAQSITASDLRLNDASSWQDYACMVLYKCLVINSKAIDYCSHIDSKEGLEHVFKELKFTPKTVETEISTELSENVTSISFDTDELLLLM